MSFGVFVKKKYLLCIFIRLLTWVVCLFKRYLQQKDLYQNDKLFHIKQNGN